MTVHAITKLLEAVEAAGLRLSREGEGLRVRGPEQARDRFTPTLKRHKAAILSLACWQCGAIPLFAFDQWARPVCLEHADPQRCDACGEAAFFHARLCVACAAGAIAGVAAPRGAAR